MQLDGKVAVVTGAGRGIGRAIAIAYAREGAKVVCSARSVDEIEAVAAEVGGTAIRCDVSDEADIRALIDGALAAYGRIDILINNAGAVARLPLHELPSEDWDHVINVNLRGVFLCTSTRSRRCSSRAAAASSTSAPAPAWWEGAPTAPSHRLEARRDGLTKVCIQEYLHRGIRTHVILPDATVSRMRHEGFPDEDPDSLIQAEDIADAAVFLATQPATAHTFELRVSQGLPTRFIS